MKYKHMEGSKLLFIRGSISAFRCSDWENLRKMSDLLRRDFGHRTSVTQTRKVITGAKLYTTV